MVVDGDVDELRTDARDLIATVSGHTVRRPRDAHQALDIDVQQIAGGRVLVAYDHRRRLQIAQPV